MPHVSEARSSASTPLPSPARGWLAVTAVAFSTFTVVTSEMLPVGLLTPIGDGLGVTEGTAGLTLTVTGLVAAVSAPFVPAALGRTDRRLALVLLMALLAAADLLSAWAPTFTVLIAARVLVGLGMGGVWALAAGLAPRLVAARSVGAATSVIFAGIAVASVLGVPTGVYIGALADWRLAFTVFAVLALLLSAAMGLLLPPLPAERGTRPRGTAGLLRDPKVATGLAVAVVLVTAHFAAYTYVRPVLEAAAGIGAGAVGALLLVYGLAGVAGTFTAGPVAVRVPRATLVVLICLLGGAVSLVPAIGVTALAAGLLMAVWGLAYGGVSVSVQAWMMRSAPEERENASALFVGAFNGSIALGALVGGFVLDGAGGAVLMWSAAALAVGALLVALLGRAPARTG
ncbi:putative MFS family arabinose efflux permease [Nocardiopsis sp. Huas11]|uniref:MFS transporter n=1 Tax=Nocardiopsis sp. Huas11 TaxID=2183912 RepID=UPI000EB05CE6|nr:MFS transporter [Nocardiopsis sp. Huas11]RKS09948.1 putative MFS family arabinose efflux permease [Nocardiopsis sp. Huas11]